MTKKSFSENYKSFIDINKELSKKFKTTKEETNIDLFKKFGGITEYIGTGNLMLNAILSGSIFGGIPNTRSIELAGPSGTGKSFLAMNIVREAQKLGYYVYYIDTEGAIDEIDMVRMGINIKQIELIKTIKFFYTLRHFITSLIEQKKKYPDLKVMIVVDSFAMLNTTKELADAKIGKSAADMGLRAKEGRQLFRNITLDLSNLAIPFLFTNHTGATLELFSQDKEIPSGGGGPTFAASIILLLEKKYFKEGSEGAKTQTGVLLKARAYKNRLAVPKTIQIHLSFMHGMNEYWGIHELLTWENCMVDKGTIFPEEEFMKKWKNGIAVNSTKKELQTFWFEKKIDKVNQKFAFVRNSSARTFAVGDTLQNIDPDVVLSDVAFTPNTKKMLDENIIKPMLQYSSVEDDLKNVSIEALSNTKVKEVKFTLEDEK